MSIAHVIVANDLRTGRVVYRDCRGDWQADIAAAERLPAPVDAAALADPRVIEPQAVALDANDAPRHYREQIRSRGPGPLAARSA